MAEELEKAGGGAVEAAQKGAPAAAASTPVTQGQASGESTPAVESLSPEIQAAIERAVSGVREEYEGKGGHIAKLKSQYDKKLSAMQQQVAQRTRAEYEQAMQSLEGGDYRTAAEILAAQVDQLQGSVLASAREQEVAGWTEKVLTDLGYDLEGSEEDAQFAGEWVERMLANPEYTWEFQQQAAKRKLEAVQKEAAKAKKDLEEVVGSLDQTVKATVTKILAGAGFAPEPTSEGGSAGGGDNWRTQPSTKLIRSGLKARTEEARKKNTQGG